ncbi:FkbM family methyltransferase [Mesobacillus maritimus]|uniref:FkbM family methyltransferase n=1 Tax=Mesobacillus maritimus TaxID=1643336 RepID=UPI00203E106F|nr:FkbM family methyltransferase [Mesobacillus maritimus]MCM3667980.1 FkbM family methyltransferase [Mesobacillus maritimus]
MKALPTIRIPVLMKMWEENPKVWKFLIDVGILIKYKTMKSEKLPSRIEFPSTTVLYVNPDENRGRALLISGGVTQSRVKHFWEKAVHRYSPDLILDVGVNYGECMFSTIYPKHCKIIGIEANHHLLKYLHQSKVEHPNQEQMTIIHALAADKEDEQKDFFIDRHWSGTSSASYKPAHQMIETIPVRTMKIDSLLKEENGFQRILFKVDVEGYEAFVLKGMSEILKQCQVAIGMIEFNSVYLSKSGVNPEEFYDYLQFHFKIYVYITEYDLREASGLSYTALSNLFEKDYIHTDFILVTGKEPNKPPFSR